MRIVKKSHFVTTPINLFLCKLKRETMRVYKFFYNEI